MSESIASYLDRLKALLAKSDPAVLHDALADAEEHLYAALDQAIEEQPGLSEDAALQLIMNEYGRPEEVAAAYRDFEQRFDPASVITRPSAKRSLFPGFTKILGDTRAYAAMIYLLSSGITGIFYGLWFLVGIGLSLYTCILIIGPFVFNLFLRSTQAFALLEGRIVEALLGVRMPRRQATCRETTGWWQGFKTRLTSKRTWTVLSYMALQLPLGCLYLYVFLGLTALAVEMMAQPVFYLFEWPYMVINGALYMAPAWSILPAVLVGFLVLVLTLHLAGFVARLHGAMAKAMLVGE
ncbi:MAG: sensor domain-containing protein [Planctomycetota bacterium]